MIEVGSVEVVTAEGTAEGVAVVVIEEQCWLGLNCISS